jgi:trans-aconitate methyltransferase
LGRKENMSRVESAIRNAKFRIRAKNQIQWFKVGCGPNRKTLRRWPRNQISGSSTKILDQEALGSPNEKLGARDYGFQLRNRAKLSVLPIPFTKPILLFFNLDKSIQGCDCS